MNVKENLQEIKQQLSSTDALLVAVSKTKPNADIIEAYEAGQRHFGENKVQEMVDKAEALPKDIHWHMIGHLQRNKVKYIAPFVHLIHSVDSLRLLKEINKQAKKQERVIPCLLQMHIAEEETKFGLDKNELKELLESEAFEAMENVKIMGLMGMATFTEDEAKVKREFASLKKLFDECKATYSGPKLDWQYLSMGMTNDYKLALEEGSNVVRIGSAIFGERNYQK